MAERKWNSADELSHAYILLSPSAEERMAVAKTLAAAAVCTAEGSVPCGNCRACRKVRAGIHPDVITVRRLADDKGRQKREIGVDQIRELIADAVVLPNESARKVYIIEDADRMNLSAQNASLKLLEEPPRGVHFLLCAANAEQLLETIRSRCEKLVCSAQEEELDPELQKLALAFVRRCAEKDEAQLFRWCAANENMDNAAAVAFTEGTIALLRDMLCRRRSSLSMSEKELYDLELLMEKALGMLRLNTGVKHVFALLAVSAING